MRRHDGSEKFYEYRPWLHYVINTFLVHHAGVLIDRIAGEVTWQGEQRGDSGKLTVRQEGKVWRVQASHFPSARETFLRYVFNFGSPRLAARWVAVGRGSRVVYEEIEELVREEDEVVSLDAKVTFLNWTCSSDDSGEIAHPFVSRAASQSDLRAAVADVFPLGVCSLVSGYLDDGGRVCSGCDQRFVGPAAVWTCHHFSEDGWRCEPYVGRYCSRDCVAMEWGLWST